MKHQLQEHSKKIEIGFEGDVLSTNSDQLRHEIFQWLESEPIKGSTWEAMDLDLTAAKMVDSAGLNLLVSLIKNAQLRGSKITARIASDNVHRTFLFAHLDKQVELVRVGQMA